MFPPIRLGRLFGIPIEARVSFLVMLAAVLLFMGGLGGIFVVLLAFGSVVLHELGHALMARRLGVGVSNIELHFFGGVARLTSQARSAHDEVMIAAAGPGVSFALAALGFLLYFGSGLDVFQLLGVVNLVIGTFNLIPALPMDGGRILRALLSTRVGFGRATELAVRVSRVTSIAFGVLGLAFMQLQLVLLAGVLWYMASAELRMAGAQGYGVPVRPRYAASPFAASHPGPSRYQRPFGFGRGQRHAPMGDESSSEPRVIVLRIR